MRYKGFCSVFLARPEGDSSAAVLDEAAQIRFQLDSSGREDDISINDVVLAYSLKVPSAFQRRDGLQTAR